MMIDNILHGRPGTLGMVGSHDLGDGRRRGSCQSRTMIAILLCDQPLGMVVGRDLCDLSARFVVTQLALYH